MSNFTFPFRTKPDSYHQSPGRFGDARSGGTRTHAGCDLYAPDGTEVLAMADGTVIEGPRLFYENVYELRVQHDNGMVVRYGEIKQTVPRGIQVGARVSQGQVIAYVGKITRLNLSMLHLEMYKGTGSGNLTQTNNSYPDCPAPRYGSYSRRADLLDPTSILDQAPLFNAVPEDPNLPKGQVNHRVQTVLNVRRQASSNSPILFSLSPGATCSLLDEITGDPYPPDNQTQWYQVQSGGQIGFAAAYYIDKIDNGNLPQFEVQMAQGQVNHRVSSTLNARSQPSTTASVVFTLTVGMTFDVLEEVSGSEYDSGRSDWLKIEYQGQIGHVAAYYVDINLDPPPAGRWDIALMAAPTTGASAVTASQDGLSAGVQASQKMAQTDLQRIKAIADRFGVAANKFGIPAALLAAIASRESRGGNILNSQGWGDGGNAFGIMQVDKRYHTIEGTPDPKSVAHIEQATGIFVDNLQQIQDKHPDWEDPYLLKGAVVAYNAGVKTVQTKAGMDIGTTGDDYGSDVIARAQYYANHADLSAFRGNS